MEKLVRAEIEARKYVLGQQRKSPSNEQQFNRNPNKLTLEAKGVFLFKNLNPDHKSKKRLSVSLLKSKSG